MGMYRRLYREKLKIGKPLFCHAEVRSICASGLDANRGTSRDQARASLRSLVFGICCNLFILMVLLGL